MVGIDPVPPGELLIKPRTQRSGRKKERERGIDAASSRLAGTVFVFSNPCF